MNDIKKSAMNMVGKQEYYDFLDRLGIPWQQRRNIYRGENLGSSFTDEQKAKIADGTFKGFFIGDYWDIGNIRYRIADINYWWYYGSVAVEANHLVIVPDGGIGEKQPLYASNTTEGGYGGSYMVPESVKNVIKGAFGENNILVHREILTNAVQNGVPVAGAWINSDIEIMNEPMVFGSHIYAPANTGNANGIYLFTIDNVQLSLFKLDPQKIIGTSYGGGRMSYWLRDVASSTQFVRVENVGYVNPTPASSAIYIRPAFGLIG